MKKGIGVSSRKTLYIEHIIFMIADTHIKQKPDRNNNLALLLCPEQDSNLHTVTGTTPSK
jgi:hypothetical protein